jgi:microsomal dipeptidase-like Zn-dependent dipeptidase
LATSTLPVVVSHTGVRGTFESPRNLSDEHIIAITQAGGMIGIGFWEGAVGSTHPADIVKAMKYVKNLVGVDNLCLGSDWDGATTIHFDAAHISVLTDEMMKSGFTNEEIKKIMGSNQVRFLLQQLP